MGRGSSHEIFVLFFKSRPLNPSNTSAALNSLTLNSAVVRGTSPIMDNSTTPCMPVASTPGATDRPEWSCIARLTRISTSIEKTKSELETMCYIRSNTSIPVPEIYFYDLFPNKVGAPFVLMERIPGRHLYKIWGGLNTDYKKAVLTQLASVLAKLARPSLTALDVCRKMVLDLFYIVHVDLEDLLHQH